MKFQPWGTAYDLLNKKLESVYPHFQEIHVQLKKGGVLISFKPYVAFMVLASIIAFATSIPISFIALTISKRNSDALSNEFPIYPGNCSIRCINHSDADVPLSGMKG